MLITDALVTCITLMPYQIYYAMYMYDADVYWTDTMSIVLGYLMLTNVFSTPIIYFALNKSYRVRILHYISISISI